MANEKISQLPSTSTSSNGDLYTLVQGGVNYSITFTNLQNALTTSLTPSQLPAITLIGDVTGSAAGGTIPTVISSATVTGKLLTGLVSGTNTPIVDSNSILTAFENLQAQIDAFGGSEVTVVTASSPLFSSGGSTPNITIQQASGSQSGFLSLTDWNTFNNKQSAGTYISELTGDGIAIGPGSAVLTLATVNSNVGSFGSSTSIPSFTVNGKGLITAASGNVVVAPAGTLTGTVLNSTVVTSSLTAVGTISTGVWNGNAISIGFGGTGQTTKQSAFNALSPLAITGDTLYFDGTNNVALNIGSNGQYLSVIGGLPSWITPPFSGTVTSVAFADDSTSPIYSISGSPVTTSGTLAITLATQSANTIFAGPTTGSATQPSFRALVSADIPNNAANTTGTAGNVTAASNSTLTTLSALTTASSLATIGTITNGTWNGTAIGIGFGGTGQNTANAAFAALSPLTTSGDIIYENATPTPARLPIGSNGQVLEVVAGLPAWTTPVTVNAINQLTGDVVAGPATGSQSEAATVAKIQGTTVSGTTGSGNVVFSNAPTLIGLLSGGSASFSSTIAASNFSGSSSGTNTGDVTLGTANGLSITAQVLSLGLASTSTTGALDSTDWNTFNSKQNTLTIGALDAQTANATGLAFVSNVLSSQSATTSFPGLVNNTTQSFSGNKTFTGTVNVSSTSVTALSVGTSTFIVDNTNIAVGIGTAPASTAVLDIVNNSGTSKAIQVTGYGSNVGFRGRRATGTLSSPTASQNGDILTFFSGRGYGASQFAAASTGIMNVLAVENFTNTSNATALTFAVTPTGSVTSAEVMRINSTGRVLIGTTTDDGIHLLQVNGSLSLATPLAIASGGTGQSTAAAAFNALSPMTTTGDTTYEASANTAARLAIGTTGQVLTVAGGLPAWTSSPGVGAALAAYFGGGLNGSATVSSTITLTGDTYYQNLTAASGGQIITAGWMLFVAGTLDLTNAPAGFIQNNGGTGGAGANTAGTAGTLGAGALGTYSNAGSTSVGGGAPGGAGGLGSKTVGAQGVVASPMSNALGGNATAAGAGGAGASGAGGGFRNGGAATNYPFNRLSTLLARVVNGGWIVLGGGAGGGAGSGGGGDGTVFGGGGGGSGGGGGVVAVYANNVIVASTTSATAIEANGGAGGNGGSPPTSTNGAGGGGAGSGGGGGAVYFVYNTRSGPASTTIGEAAGGNGANGGTGIGTSGTNGGGSGGGWSGQTIAINASTGVITVVSTVIGNLASGQTGGTGAVSLLTI
jgi:hypothetical protein